MDEGRERFLHRWFHSKLQKRSDPRSSSMLSCSSADIFPPILSEPFDEETRNNFTLLLDFSTSATSEFIKPWVSPMIRSTRSKTICTSSSGNKSRSSRSTANGIFAWVVCHDGSDSLRFKSWYRASSRRTEALAAKSWDIKPDNTACAGTSFSITGLSWHKWKITSRFWARRCSMSGKIAGESQLYSVFVTAVLPCNSIMHDAREPHQALYDSSCLSRAKLKVESRWMFLKAAPISLVYRARRSSGSRFSSDSSFSFSKPRSLSLFCVCESEIKMNGSALG